MLPTFLSLPAEIRVQIYREILSAENAEKRPAPTNGFIQYYDFRLSLLYVNKQIHIEAKKIFQDNVFVKITTPWPESVLHIGHEGRVPLVAEGPRTAAFAGYHLLVSINRSESVDSSPDESVSMVICLQDLPAFTRMWNYSDLNYHGELNPALVLDLIIQDPHAPDCEVPKDLQEALLLPFGAIKNLNRFSLQGTRPHPSVSQRLANLRTEPNPTVEFCLAASSALEEEGNVLLKAGKHLEALELYIRAFAVIHIDIDGRNRHIHVDDFYNARLTSGPDRGKLGLNVRVLLRLRLVADVVQAYLSLRQFDDAYFWGKRSILLLLQMTTEDRINEFDLTSCSDLEHAIRAGRRIENLEWIYPPGQMEAGKIFYRTAQAARQLGEKEKKDVRILMIGANMYLPQDEEVQRQYKEFEALETHEI